MGTTILKAKLIHHLIAMKQAVLHTIFLDIQKAHKALDRYHSLNILEAYGVGPWTICLLWAYCNQNMLIIIVLNKKPLPVQGPLEVLLCEIHSHTGLE